MIIGAVVQYSILSQMSPESVNIRYLSG